MAGSLDLFGDRWSILVIREVMNGVRRFDDLVGRLEISRATLSDRLRRLTEAGILATAEYDSGRGRTRTEYRLTESGWDLRNVLIALRERTPSDARAGRRRVRRGAGIPRGRFRRQRPPIGDRSG